jgi:8-oxo-dGTP pyrophosphatase MutT (NUDIX family)
MLASALMLKYELVAAVRARAPVDSREQACIAEFLTRLDQLGDDWFDEHANPVHVTVTGLIVGARGIVLHRHRILGTWVAPGGHIDAGESPLDAVVREAGEETGMIVGHVDGVPNLVHVDVHPGPREHTHFDLRYLLDGGSADPDPPPGKSQEVAWFRWDDALAITEAHMKGIIRVLSTPR